jgi:methylmalonyl-CoA mutase C-terminal domain/subunit
MTAQGQKIRVLVGKPGLDGHDRGARVIAAALRDAGMEVIYTGLRASVQQIASAAVQEDADVIGLSILSGAHVSICKRLREELQNHKADIPVVVGGIIPDADHAALQQHGVSAVFGPESPLNAVVETVRALAMGAPVPEAGSRKPVAKGIPSTRLDHAAIAVADLDGALALLSEILGQPVAHREKVATQKIEAAFFDFPNGASLEVIASLPELGGNAGVQKFIEKRGDGLHHLALRVKDLDALLLRLDQQGVPLIDKVSRPGARGHKVAFLHPKAFKGALLLELVEAHE